jgi:hypothetical protein
MLRSISNVRHSISGCQGSRCSILTTWNCYPCLTWGQLSCQIGTIPRVTLKLLNHQTVIQIGQRESLAHSFVSFTPRFQVAFSMLNAKLPDPLRGGPSLSGILILEKSAGLNHCITKKIRKRLLKPTSQSIVLTPAVFLSSFYLHWMWVLWPTV